MKLSVITINYNNLDGLKKTAESVLNQTWTDYEWIIVDGGSTDGSKEYIEKLAETLSHEDKITGTSWDIERFSLLGFTAKDMEVYVSDSPIKEKSDVRKLLWCSEPDKGIYNAMNKGIAKASGEYINFMNSGDFFYERNTLEKVSTYLNEGNADVYYGDKIDVDGDVTRWTQTYPDSIDLFYLYCNTLGHQAQYTRTSFLKNTYFDEEYKIAGDHAMNVELSVKGCSFKHLPFFAARFDSSGISARCKEIIPSELERIRDEYLPANILPVLSKLYKYEYGHIYQRVNNVLCKGGLPSFLLKAFLKILGTK